MRMYVFWDKMSAIFKRGALFIMSQLGLTLAAILLHSFFCLNNYHQLRFTFEMIIPFLSRSLTVWIGSLEEGFHSSDR